MRKKIAVTFVVLIAALLIVGLTACSSFHYPDANDRIDLNNMQLVFEDDFDTFNKDIWWTNDDGIRRGGYWDISQVKAQDGNLVITTEYRDGQFGQGWYTGGIYTKGRSEFVNGYAEVRCKMPKGQGLWGAFWLLSQKMKANENGTEIDVIESAYYDDPYNPSEYKNTAFHTIHADGYGDEHKSRQSGYYFVDNIYEEFHTYGVYWDELGYNFYVDGMSTWKTKFHPSTEPEYLFLSVEVAGKANSGDPSNPKNKYTWGGEIENNDGGKDFKSDFLIDYVKVYQNK